MKIPTLFFLTLAFLVYTDGKNFYLFCYCFYLIVFVELFCNMYIAQGSDDASH